MLLSCVVILFQKPRSDIVLTYYATYIDNKYLYYILYIIYYIFIIYYILFIIYLYSISKYYNII